jgi:predicted nuclease with RNAse H fold
VAGVKSLGVDLAGSERRPTGVCLLDQDLNARVWVAHADAEIVELALAARPDVVAVDAPLTIPRGRRSIEDASGPPPEGVR